jgi:hypothetical protein
MLTAYARAGGRDAALLIHSQGAGARLVDELGRAARTDRSTHGVPARVLPVGVWHTASVGLDLWLTALAQGASQVWVLLTAEEAPEYRQALAEQMAVAQALLTGLGYSGRHFKLIEARDARDLGALDQALREAAAQGRQARHTGTGAGPPAGPGRDGARIHRAAGPGLAPGQPADRHRALHHVPELRRCLP